MAGRFRIWARKQYHQRVASTHGSDIVVAPGRHWALGLMIVGSAGALLATSDVKHPVYKFEKSNDGPRASLTASKPHAGYLMRVRVNTLGPEQVDSTESAIATVHGTIASSANANAGADAGSDAGSGETSRFVTVRFREPEQASDAAAALTSFNLSRPLHFSGDCATPDQGAPCEAELELEFELKQASVLQAGESLTIDWSVDFESRAFRPNSDRDETSEAPWTVEFVELSKP